MTGVYVQPMLCSTSIGLVSLAAITGCWCFLVLQLNHNIPEFTGYPGGITNQVTLTDNFTDYLVSDLPGFVRDNTSVKIRDQHLWQ